MRNVFNDLSSAPSLIRPGRDLDARPSLSSGMLNAISSVRVMMTVDDSLFFAPLRWRSRVKDGADPILCVCRIVRVSEARLRGATEGGVAGSALLRDRVGARLLVSYDAHQNTQGVKPEKKGSLAAPARCNGTFCCTEVNISCGGDLGCKYLGVKTQRQGSLRAGDGKYVSRST